VVWSARQRDHLIGRSLGAGLGVVDGEVVDPPPFPLGPATDGSAGARMGHGDRPHFAPIMEETGVDHRVDAVANAPTDDRVRHGIGAGRKWVGRMKLLVAEDDDGVRQLLRETFAERGLTVEEAWTGAQTLQLARERQPDLILLDVQLGDDDGFALCRQLKADPATAAVPIIFLTARHAVHDRVRGLELGAVDYVPKPFELEELLARVGSALRVKASQDALRARQEELETLVHTDALTGLYNRRFLDERIAQEVVRAQRYRQALAFVMLDIDHFKRINDVYGHSIGDQGLRLLADLVRAELRLTDVAVRWGGEEFLLMLPATDRDGAARLVERIRAQLRRLPLSVDGQAIYLQISAGVTELRAEGDSIDAAVERADQALLQAKRTGRDRVCFG